MDGRADNGIRILGVLAGVGAMLPVGFLTFLAIQSCPVGYLAGQAIRIPLQFTVLFSGTTLALLVATVAVADGQAWGALVIAIYGAGIALLIFIVDRTGPAAGTGDAAVIALHVAIAVLALAVMFGLAGGHPAPRAPEDGPL